MMTYLELVNRAILEAKVTLDPLTAANFADPPRTRLYNDFKRWVADAYSDLLITRNEWHFTQERQLATIGPRIFITGLSYTPSPGDVLQGQKSQFQVTVLAVHTFEDDELKTPNTFTLDIALPDGKRIADFAVGETLDQITPTPTVGVATMDGPGFYNLIDGYPDVAAINKWDIQIFDHPDYITAPGTNQPSGRTLVCVPWQTWVAEYAQWNNTGNIPYYVTQTPQGTYDFYPHPDKNYLVQIEYTRGPSPLVAWDDVPVGVPERVQDIITWMAIESFADFDSNTRLFARANKRVEFYNNILERDEMATVGFARNKFYRRRYIP